MKITFENDDLKDLFAGFPPPKNNIYKSNPQLVKRYIKTINILKSLTKISDLINIKSLHYERKEGDLKGVDVVWVDRQYRLFLSIKNTENSTTTIESIHIMEFSKHYER